jgi:uncharacterized membrane protein SpoIIM required for sporulation
MLQEILLDLKTHIKTALKLAVPIMEGVLYVMVNGFFIGFLIMALTDYINQDEAGAVIHAILAIPFILIAGLMNDHLHAKAIYEQFTRIMVLFYRGNK